MAPPEQPFPVSELEHRVKSYSKNFKEKSRKLGDFDLKRDCELFELVQYSCTTIEQQYERALKSGSDSAQIECFPFVRLFRRYGVLAANECQQLFLTMFADVVRAIRCFTSKPLHGKANMRGKHQRIILRRQLGRLQMIYHKRRASSTNTKVIFGRKSKNCCLGVSHL